MNAEPSSSYFPAFLIQMLGLGRIHSDSLGFTLHQTQAIDLCT
jgi:hypothetical protein